MFNRKLTIVIAALTTVLTMQNSIIYCEAAAPAQTVAISASATSTAYSDLETEAFVTMLNEYRTANGLQPVKESTALDTAAQTRMKESTVAFSHTRPDGTAFYTVDEENVYGENLAREMSSVQMTFDSWKASPAHNVNLLDPAYTEVGFASENGYMVAEFKY